MKIQISLSATPILYHITNFLAALSIVGKNRFELKPSDGTDVEEALQNEASYYLSTARHKTAAYTRENVNQNAVIFVLDGIKLATKYKIKPVDYWAKMYNDASPTAHRRDYMESEDRVLSSKPTIDKASRYVTEIHAFRGTDKQAAGKKDRLTALYKFALRHKIAIYFYADRKDMLILNTRKAVALDRENIPAGDSYPARRPSEYEYKFGRGDNQVAGWIQLYEIPVKHRNLKKTKVTENAMSALRYHRTGEALRSLINGMHNEKSTPYDTIGRGREDLDKLIKILRTHKWKPADFINFLADKWINK